MITLSKVLSVLHWIGSGIYMLVAIGSLVGGAFLPAALAVGSSLMCGLVAHCLTLGASAMSIIES